MWGWGQSWGENSQGWAGWGHGWGERGIVDQGQVQDQGQGDTHRVSTTAPEIKWPGLGGQGRLCLR